MQYEHKVCWHYLRMMPGQLRWRGTVHELGVPVESEAVVPQDLAAVPQGRRLRHKLLWLASYCPTCKAVVPRPLCQVVRTAGNP